MQDEYEPRDLKYDDCKQQFQGELQGPSLKRMDATKRIAIIQQTWQKEEDEEEIDTK